jgi:hypothetical protein
VGTGVCTGLRGTVRVRRAAERRIEGSMAMDGPQSNDGPRAHTKRTERGGDDVRTTARDWVNQISISTELLFPGFPETGIFFHFDSDVVAEDERWQQRHSNA